MHALRALCALVVMMTGAVAAENPAEELEEPNVVIIGTSPLPGLGARIERVPANVQVFSSTDIEGQHPASVSEFLAQNAGSVNINDAQGNGYQPDLLFRGFAASPLLGTPQGISVFQDGVRVNEPFGDVVNWDLIPTAAIANLQIIPGSNPVFGLNTLGGALAVYTKSGAEYPGWSAEASGGSFERSEGTITYGAHWGRWDAFLTGTAVDDAGWAQHNPSRVKQIFGKLGFQTDISDVDLSFTGADNQLQGTQTIPQSFFDNPAQAYTFPDANQNQLSFLSVKGSHFLTANALLGGNLYWRREQNDTQASNVNGDYGSVDPLTGAIDTVQATNDLSVTDQDSAGASVQLTLSQLPGLPGQQWVVGFSADRYRVDYHQSTQEAAFSSARETVAQGAYFPGTHVHIFDRGFGAFVMDTWTLAPHWTATFSGRFNHTNVQITDRSGQAPSLDGQNAFSRFNPALGVAFNPSSALTVYASFNEGMRVPTPSELTCADPDAPCKLPNNFISDPPLRPVVSHTVELGARGLWGPSTNWSAALFRTDLSDDIQFISSGSTALESGYFQNVGHTRRQGLELGAGGKCGSLAGSLHLSLIEASFRTAFEENSPANSAASGDGTIEVAPGNRMPGIPRAAAKLRLDYALSDRFNIGLNVVADSATYARGDENNLDERGMLPGYAVFNLDARYQFGGPWSVFASIDNVLDRQYANLAVLAPNVFTGPGHTFNGSAPTDEQFRAASAPRGMWLGVRYAPRAGAEVPEHP